MPKVLMLTHGLPLAHEMISSSLPKKTGNYWEGWGDKDSVQMQLMFHLTLP